MRKHVRGRMDGSMVAFLSASSFAFRFLSLAIQPLTLLAAEEAGAAAVLDVDAATSADGAAWLGEGGAAFSASEPALFLLSFTLEIQEPILDDMTSDCREAG